MSQVTDFAPKQPLGQSLSLNRSIISAFRCSTIYLAFSALASLSLTLSAQAETPGTEPSPVPTNSVPTAPLELSTAPEVKATPPPAQLPKEDLPAPAPPVADTPASAPKEPQVKAPEAPLKAEAAPLPVEPLPEPPKAEVEHPPTLPVVEEKHEEAPEAPQVAEKTNPEPDSPGVSTQYNPRIPRYQQMLPSWGIEFTASGKPLGSSDLGIDPNVPDSKTLGFSLKGEYQPLSVQKYGILSFGPSLSLYPTYPENQYATLFGLWSVGAQIRYQARYFREQPIVPLVGFALEYWNYHFKDGTLGGFTATGPFAGLMFLLNVIAPGEAADFYANYDVKRSYLVAEYRSLSGTNAVRTLTGGSFFFGLRFEF